PLRCPAEPPALCSFTPPPTPHTYPLSLHDALPILHAFGTGLKMPDVFPRIGVDRDDALGEEFFAGDLRAGQFAVANVRARRAEKDRKSTRLNSSHRTISYAVFCLKKKKKQYRMLLD